jgi:HemY protein
MRLSLWGKAQQLFKQSLPLLRDERLQRNAWRSLALLAEQRGDAEAAEQAWRKAAQG